MHECAPHTDLPTPRPSACPGLLRIVQALDGGICRVKLPGGNLTAAQARALAEAAQHTASGVLELTNRSNLQVRGVRPSCERQLIDALFAAGLGPAVAEADDVRNLMLSPAAGLDPAAVLDTRPLAAELLALLQHTPALHALSPKFAIQLDGGEALNMLAHPHDLWLRAVPEAPGQLAFGLAGCPSERPLAQVALSDAGALVEAVLLNFLALAEPSHSRMRQLLEAIGAEGFLRQLQARLPFALSPAADYKRRPVSERAPIGLFAQRQAGLTMVAAGARLGRIDAGQLRRLAELAERHGDASLRLTPWQGLLLPNVPTAQAEALLAGLHAQGLLTDDDPLSGLIACTGSAACAKGLADTKADALRLAAQLRQSGARPQVHLSGCPRSCAAAHVAPYTLLATDGGHYQLYQRVAGIAGFGRPIAAPMGIDQASTWLAQRHATGSTDA